MAYEFQTSDCFSNIDIKCAHVAGRVTQAHLATKQMQMHTTLV